MDTNQPFWSFIDARWEQSIIPALERYIRIPNQSPLFDPGWATAGHMDEAVSLVSTWLREQDIAGGRVEVIRLGERTPVVLLEVPGTTPHAPTALLYGHIDKQPPFDGWRTEEGLGPWTPALRGERLYGRGGADDGYAAFASATAVKALQVSGAAMPRIVGIFECSEESGSPDLPAYVEHLAERIGNPVLVVCLDSGCGDYERLWWTTSLRGMVAGELRVDVLTEGIHSGQGTGVVPSSFRIIRQLLERIEDATTGQIRLPELHAAIPDIRREQAELAARILGPELFSTPPFAGTTRAVATDGVELILNRTWRPGLEVTGQSGIPSIAGASNVLRPHTSLRLSVRLPPTADAAAAQAALERTIEHEPPYGASVRFTSDKAGTGWEAPAEAPWLLDAISEASLRYFGKEPCAMGEGGSIPFMGMLGERFPAAQFLITGVLGPESNAHGPNEFLHVPTAMRLTACVAHVLQRVAALPEPAVRAPS